MTRPSRRFAWTLAVVAAIGLAIRVAYVIYRRDAPVGGDPFFYHYGANLLVEGKGFILPLPYLIGRRRIQAADHPPLYLLWLAIPSVIGLDTPLPHLLWSSVLGTGTVVMCGLVGREVAGPRAGIIAAVLTAVYPNIWGHDGMLEAETLALFTAVLVVFLAYRYWKRRTLWRLVALGASCGAAALARSELLLMLPLAVLPLALLTRSEPLTRRLKWFAASGLATVVVLAPWVGYNMTRFKHPVYLSSGFEVTLLTATCDTTYYGPLTGFWSMSCGIRTPRNADQSEIAMIYRRKALDYISHHKSRVPIVTLARWGRITGLWHPGQQTDLETFIDGRDRFVTVGGLVMWYPIAALAAVGAVLIRRRRRVPLFPLLALPAIALFAVTMTFAQTRYRVIAEGALVVLAAVAIDTVVAAASTRRGSAWRDRDQHPSEAVEERAVTGALTPASTD